MTKFLEKAFAKAPTLSIKEQDAIADKLLRELENMSKDLNIQHDLRAVNKEFSVTDFDGLAKL